MRSKEVSDAIDLLENGIADYIIEDYCIKNENKLCGTYCEKMKEDCIYNQAIDKVIEYIETLEQLPNKIRDKIKELEEERRKIESSPYDKWDLYKVIGKIEVLKSIIGE